jgi:hypothetical protein
MGRALIFAAVMGLMPEACAKILGQPADRSAQTDPPPIIPSATVTAPPTYQPPDLGPPPTSAPPPGASPELVKAREAEDKKDYKKVKSLLEKKVKSGKATREEAQLLADACNSLKDKACLDSVRKTHPEVDGI